MKKKIVCIIPARLQSKRFPHKVLATLKGRPLLQWVWQAAQKVSLFDEIGFAVDSVETASLVESFHGRWWMTSPGCASGTDRLAELALSERVQADIWVNWQADEPFIREALITDLLQDANTEQCDVWTLKKRILQEEEYLCPNIAKVVCDQKGFALFFSRSPIPFYRDGATFSQKKVYKHIGLYAYTSQALKTFSSLRECALEEVEKLEQLRFLYHGLKIRVHETDHEVLGIDTPEDLAKAESYIEQNLKSW